jgi:hypothetical protein
MSNSGNLVGRHRLALTLVCGLLWLLTATIGVRDVHLWAEGTPPPPSPRPAGLIVDYFPNECSVKTLEYSSKAIPIAPLVLFFRYATTGRPQKCLEQGYAVVLWFPTVKQFPVVITLASEHLEGSI